MSGQQPPNGWGSTPGGDWAPPAGPPQPGWTPAYQAPQAPKPGVVPLRPLAFGEILDGAFTMIQRYPTILLGFSAALYAVVSGLGFLLSNVVGVEAALTPLEQANTLPEDEVLPVIADAFGALGVFLGVTMFLQWIIGGVLTGVITITAARGVLGRSATVRSAWRSFRGRLPKLLALTLLIGLAILGVMVVYFGVVIGAIVVTQDPVVTLLLVFIGGLGMLYVMLWLAVRWAVAPAALVLETRSAQGVQGVPGTQGVQGVPGTQGVQGVQSSTGPVADRRSIGILEALGRSWRLVKGRSWRTFGIIIVAGLIAAVVAGILEYAFTLLGTAVSEVLDGAEATGTALVGGIGAVSGGVLQIAFISAVNVLVYTDARMRTEGLDIELTATVGARTAGADDDPEAPWSVR